MLVSLLPDYNSPATLLVGDSLPCHKADIKNIPSEYLLRELDRQVWAEGLYVKKNDLDN